MAPRPDLTVSESELSIGSWDVDSEEIEGADEAMSKSSTVSTSLRFILTGREINA